MSVIFQRRDDRKSNILFCANFNFSGIYKVLFIGMYLFEWLILGSILNQKKLYQYMSSVQFIIISNNGGSVRFCEFNFFDSCVKKPSSVGFAYR